MIQIKNLSKNFRTEEVETIALNGISMEVKKGEFIAIMGPSGCGKSTLLHILGLLDNPDEGSYLLEGEEVGHLKEKDRTRYRKGRIGFVFQSFNLIDELTVEENVDLQLKYLGIPKAERKQQVLDILRNKCAKRNVDVRFLVEEDVQKIGGDKVKQIIKVKNGVASDDAKKIVKLIKDSKIKVQASIQGDAVRVSGAKRDDLQAVMALLRKDISDLPLTFDNFRD